jgi:PAS domain S-box-containing protein
LNLLAFNRVLRTTLLMPVVLLGLLAGVLVWQIQEAVDAQTRVAIADELIQRLYQLQSSIVDEETGLRGYQLTGDRRMLEPVRREQIKVEDQFTQLTILLATPEQRLRLAQLHDSYSLWEGYAFPAMRAGKQNVTPDQLALDLQAKIRMDQMRLILEDIIRSEQQSRDSLWLAAHSRIHDFLEIVLVAGLAVGVLIGAFTSSRLRRVSRAYEETLQQLQTRADELYESRLSYMTTLESIAEGVIACDTVGRVRFMNAVAQLLTGWTMEEALEQPLTEVFRAVNEQTREPLDQPTESADAQGQAVTRELPALLLARDDREIVISRSAAPIRDAMGKTLGLVVVFRDITEARKSEQALIASEKVAVTGRLAASIAHEIHNPLDSVATLHYLLKSEQDPAKRDEYLTMAQQELSRILQISRAMLSLYRESQTPVEVKLPEVIDSVLLLHDRKLKDAEIQVERRYKSPGIIAAFPGEIRQIITNVIANAMEASGKDGGICVTIRRSSLQDGEPGTVIEVEDTGSGVDPAIRKKLFQPFFTTKGEKGTGLGLWVSLGIVQKHGGTMEISNSLSRRMGGACVRIYLPEKFDGNLSAPTPVAPIVEGSADEPSTSLQARVQAG